MTERGNYFIRTWSRSLLYPGLSFSLWYKKYELDTGFGELKVSFFLFLQKLEKLDREIGEEWGSTLWTWRDGLLLVQGKGTACSAGLSPRYWSLSRATPRSGKTSICDASIHFSKSWIPVTQLSWSLAGELVEKERGRIGREGESKERTPTWERKGSFYKGQLWPALTLEKCLWGCSMKTEGKGLEKYKILLLIYLICSFLKNMYLPELFFSNIFMPYVWVSGKFSLPGECYQ